MACQVKIRNEKEVGNTENKCKFKEWFESKGDYGVTESEKCQGYIKKLLVK